ncbi:MAG: transposase [Rickettsiales bacterium]|jgi:hypothetical protein|nr:transposase [Rickettsiales bacterium]
MVPRFQTPSEINNREEMMNFRITKGNVFDNVNLVRRTKFGGKLFGDKEYPCREEVLEKLKKEYNIVLTTKNKKNMKI